MKTKDKQIIQDNILIAEFMGGKPANAVKNNPIAYIFPFEFGHQETWDEGGFQGSGKSFCWDIEDLQYHSDWNWLMMVIEKINSTHGEGLVGRDLQYTIQYLLSGGYGFTDNERKKVSLTLENLFERAVLFIKWYNETKDKK